MIDLIWVFHFILKEGYDISIIRVEISSLKRKCFIYSWTESL